MLTTIFLSCMMFSSAFASSGWPSTIPAPADQTVATKVQWIWQNVIRPTVTSGRGSYNTFFDQLYATAAMGKFQVCIRWDSRQSVSVAQRDCIEGMLQRHIRQWTDKLIGYDGWPWGSIPLRISGWAVYDASLLAWKSTDNNVPIYVGDTSFENAPQCPQNCGRFFHTQQNYTYPNCPGGAANHYDWSSWHSQSMDGMGFGSDWGQRTLSGSTLSGCSGQMMIILHEMGHGFFLPDFYSVSVPGGNPTCVMVAGSSSTVTAYDEWMLKRVYSELKRMSGRFPAVHTVQASPPIPQIRQFAVAAENNRITYRCLSGVSGTIQLGIYDLAGRSIASHASTVVSAIQSTQPLGPGTYLVKIKGAGISEVHRIRIGD